MPDLKIAKAVVIERSCENGTGKLRFELPVVHHVPDLTDITTLTLKVQRFDGFEGVLGCRYQTKPGSAREKNDYMEAKGELRFEHQVNEMEIKVQICKKASWENKDTFYVDLFDLDEDKPVVAADGKICTVKIGATDQSGLICKVGRLLDGAVNFDATAEGSVEWLEHFRAALRPVNGDEEDSYAASAEDWTLHFIALPWKLLFAMVPPTSYCGGWVTFFIALVMIGGVTAVIGDLANLLGCCLNMPAGITAITIVALGTSLPDAFASKVAAVEDPSADAAIGNVTGSNSVNVFLGLGLPWMIGSLYWDSAGPTEEWRRWYPDMVERYPNGGFVVMSGDLSFSVLVFCMCACMALGIIGYRRKAFGAELGGPTGVKTNTAVFFLLLWFFYAGVASWKMIVKEQGTTEMCIAAVCIGFSGVIFGQVVISFILHCMEQSKASDAKSKKDMHEALIAGVARRLGEMDDVIRVGSLPNQIRRLSTRRNSKGIAANGSSQRQQAKAPGPSDAHKTLQDVRVHLEELRQLVDHLDATIAESEQMAAAAPGPSQAPAVVAPKASPKPKATPKANSGKKPLTGMGSMATELGDAGGGIQVARAPIEVAGDSPRGRGLDRE
jgi:Ca2+/Na+ antiporter